MKKIKNALFLLCLALLYHTNGFSVEWAPSFEQAEQQAKAQNKPIVLLFTGSNWCKWCIRLEEEILNTKEFEELTRGKFIFVKADFPRGKKLAPHIAAENEKLKKQFHTRGFPTVFVLDKNLQVLGRTGYRQGGPSAYARQLESFLQKK